MDNIIENLAVHDIYRTEQMLLKACSEQFETCIWGAGAIGTGFGKQIIEEYGVQVDYYCDNNPELLNTEIVSGIYCRSKEKLINNAEKTICFVLVGYAVIGEIYCQLVKAGIKNIITYDDMLELPTTMRRHLPYLNRKDTAVYICITGDYDDVREPKYVSDRCDYFLLSDKKLEKPSIYQWLDIKEFIPDELNDPIAQNRYCKINTHKIFPQYRYSVYVDGNITITGNITENIDRLKDARIGVLAENYTDNVNVYALRCGAMRADLPEKLINQLESYWLQGMPENSGSFACGVLVREHNNPICIKLMEDWWREYCIHTKRDQISFTYILWKNGFNKNDILVCCPEGYNAWNKTPYWEYTPKHKKEHFKA